jgi:2-phosphosulfolactate phosphatase
MKKIFTIDSLPERALQYRSGWAVVAIDVIRATTMTVTAAALGRRCFPVDTLASAFQLSRMLQNPLLAGELAGDMPAGFELNNSPAALSKRTDVSRPLVMLSSSGTRLIVNARGCDRVYLGCFRNCRATASHLIEARHPKIALIGAGSRNEFREEDQIGCAWIASDLVKAGYVPEDKITAEVLSRWGTAQATDCLISHSVDYLKKTNQEEDLEFILERINDLNETYIFHSNEVMLASVTPIGASLFAPPPMLIPDLSASCG